MLKVLMEMGQILYRSHTDSQTTLCISLYYRWIFTVSHIIRLKFYWPEIKLWPNNFKALNDYYCYCYYCQHYYNHLHLYTLVFILFLATTAKSHPISKPTTLMLHDDDLHMAVDIVNDQQLIPVLSNYHSTNYMNTLAYVTSNNNHINNDNIDDIDNDDNDNDLTNMQWNYRTIPIIKRRKRFAQTSRWDKMTSDNVLKLKWFISKYTRDMPRSEIRSVIRKSFTMWSTQTIINSMPSVKLQFEEALYEDDADIVILWAEGDHGDAYKFDGTGNHTNILAHTFYPTYQEDGHLNGDIHLDDAEKWISDNRGDGTSFPNVFIHEIGHSLGLGHSKRADAIMYPIYKKDMIDNASFDLDDKCALNWNYIGPTNLCLFVWLMSEVLPRQIEHKMNDYTSGVDFNIIQRSTNDDDSQSKIITLKEQLQGSGIPLCNDNNNVREKFERLLEKKLDFSIRHASEYGNVMCNFLAGLRKRLDGDGSDKLFDQATLQVTSINYLRILSQPLRFPLRRKQRRLHSKRSFNRHHRHGQLSSIPANSIFHSEFFTDDFYKEFLKIYVQ
uniref:ZnMc domain-containing protein n=2 Tax=Brugia malayi TaxID=6279 RepID=A0A5S6PND3_BRUMA